MALEESEDVWRRHKERLARSASYFSCRRVGNDIGSGGGLVKSGTRQNWKSKRGDAKGKDGTDAVGYVVEQQVALRMVMWSAQGMNSNKARNFIVSLSRTLRKKLEDRSDCQVCEAR